MQVIDKINEGLKREFNVVVAAAAIHERVEARLVEVGQQVRLPGFRPGKVPMDLLRKRFGQSVRGEVLERTIDESTQAALAEKAIKPASQPKVELVTFEDGSDLEFAIKLEVLPEITPNDLAGISLTRGVVAVGDAEIDKAIENLRRNRGTLEAVGEDRPAAAGDAVIGDFVGRVGGEVFEGGSAQDATIEIGANNFIPGFEDQLIGARKGATVEVKVTFPTDYHANLAGKDAVFEVTVKDIKQRILPALDDAFAKSLGMEDLSALRQYSRKSLEDRFAKTSRLHTKRQLLDRLAEGHSFPVPEGMVDAEFGGIWRQIEEAMKAGQLDAEDAAKSEEDLRAEYRGIAERRVRLGLLLSDIGQKNNVTVLPEDFSKAVMEEAQRYPGQESAVVEYYQRNPNALESLRAPIFEEKVVDFIISRAAVTDLPVTAEELAKQAGGVG
ncbi:MAG: trigger factor [Rhodospirillaceae bacterium]|nr:MAG: trigger factor [Rhodospirillaceae bacterium]